MAVDLGSGEEYALKVFWEIDLFEKKFKSKISIQKRIFSADEASNKAVRQEIEYLVFKKKIVG